jgi:hypothetical protein
MKALDDFSEIWFVDFEFRAVGGNRPEPVCMVARRLEDGTTIRWWSDDIRSSDTPPFSIDSNTLFVAYYASAELGCFLAANWPFPVNILDLYVEFRNKTNGNILQAGSGLVGALQYHGLPSIESATKDAMRDLVLSSGEHTEEQRERILEYCKSDVIALEGLFNRMAPNLDLPRALLRGRYMKAAAQMEWCGTPIDVQTLDRLRGSWEPIQEHLISRIDSNYGVYEGTSFRQHLFANWLQRNHIPWPTLDSGRLALDSRTFREQAKAYPEVAPLYELRHTLGELRLESLLVGQDGRNRCLLSPFRAKSSRNIPSNSKFIFGPSCWMRSLIQPAEGRSLAYIDWSQQEFGIAAVLSEDANMQAAYRTGDPYLEFAKQAGAVPEDATKESHPGDRERFKTCILGVQYGMGENSLAQKIGQSPAHARQLLDYHRRTYPDYWKWSQGAVDHGMLRGYLYSIFGWTLHVDSRANPRSLANFPMQANGAEMLRLACCYATEAGIQVCAPVHDAILVEGATDSMAQVIADTQAAMLRASRDVLNGFELRTDVEVVNAPNRYMDPRGETMWNTIMSILDELENGH